MNVIISIHTAFAGCDVMDTVFGCIRAVISIHTAFAGCDCLIWCWISMAFAFQSTQPSQAVTLQTFEETAASEDISIHTAFAGCDLSKQTCPNSVRHFNPHSLRRL